MRLQHWGQAAMTTDVRTWRARVDQIHDGDTVRLIIDVGFDATSRKWLRLRRVFAPELKQTGGPTTKQFTSKWLTSLPPATWPLSIDTYRTSGDNDLVTLERYVAEVRDAATGASLNDAVIAYLALHPKWPSGTGG